MSTYVIGDVQGCYRTLRALLRRIDWHPQRDRLWLTGDLVNRGPRSLEVLRWAADQGDRLVTVLGNHDLHLLLVAAGQRETKKGDTLDDVLEARDRDELVAWLTGRPLVFREGRFLLVHGGLWPTWTADGALRLSDEASRALASGEALPDLARPRRAAWDPSLTGVDRAVAAMRLMTTLRMLDQGGEPLKYNGPPDEAPDGAVAWYDAPGRRSRDVCVLFGHWAAHGFAYHYPDWVALDSGCVWGNLLTALRLDDMAVFQEPAVDGAAED